MLTLLIRLLWLAMCLLMAIAWIVQLPLGPFGLMLPYATMLLSLRVFHSSPKTFRYIHHSFIASTIIISLIFVIRFLFYSGDQGGIAAFFLVYGVAMGYLLFIALFGLLLKLNFQMRPS
ncbi:MAG: hypothetical protein RQ783_07590 [Gammaproteobacteria bacterium]|nr:hypothetical protein [Gammaproteobacteria bacterium]